MNVNEMINLLRDQPNKNCEITVMVDCLYDLELEENTYNSLLALFRRNVKSTPLYNLRMVLVSGLSTNILNIIANSANSRFFENVKFGVNDQIVSI